MNPQLFRLWVWLHLIVAGLLLGAIVVVRGFAVRRFGDQPILVRRSQWLFWLFFVQLGLGVAAWVTHYNWPLWFADWIWEFDYTIAAAGRWQALLTTAHVAVGSLALVVALSLTWWSLRLTAAASAGQPAKEPISVLETASA